MRRRAREKTREERSLWLPSTPSLPSTSTTLGVPTTTRKSGIGLTTTRTITGEPRAKSRQRMIGEPATSLLRMRIGASGMSLEPIVPTIKSQTGNTRRSRNN